MSSGGIIKLVDIYAEAGLCFCSFDSVQQVDK